jgi:hypothetical protein
VRLFVLVAVFDVAGGKSLSAAAFLKVIEPCPFRAVEFSQM